MTYVVKKCENYSYGKNKWDVVFTSLDAESAVGFIKTEFRYLLEADHSLTRKDINGKLNNYYLDNYGNFQRSRIELIHKNVSYSLLKSSSDQYQYVPKRPDRTALLDSILG